MLHRMGISLPASQQICPHCKRTVKVEGDEGMPGGLVYERHFPEAKLKETDGVTVCGQSGKPVDPISHAIY